MTIYVPIALDAVLQHHCRCRLTPSTAFRCRSNRTAPAKPPLISIALLCRHVTFYRPSRGDYGERAIWDSHRALARDALANGCRSALMLEDDVLFRQSWAKLARSIERAMAALPSDWWCLYLGHLPQQAYFVRLRILRTRSALTHAYIAGPRLLAWLAETEPFSVGVATWRRIGGLDGSMANLPGMYALFPMAAVQRFLGDYRIDTRIDRAGRSRSWRDPERWRYVSMFYGASVVEGMAVLLSPFHWLTLERNRRRGEKVWLQNVRLIQTVGLFDDDFYLRCRPDVAESGVSPLWHYMLHGAREGTWPSLLFDPRYYAAQSPDLGQENPLIHFINVGTALGRKPHPLFDTKLYLSRYAAMIPQGAHPLTHFLTVGGASGFDPHALFDCAWYLSRHPQLQGRQNPLVHYLTEGWRTGAAPHPQFDGDLYLQWNPDVKAAGINPLYHFVCHGQFEGRAQPILPH